MIGDGIFHIFYLTFTGRGRRLMAEMMPSMQDVRDSCLQLAFYLGLRPQGPDFGRFSYGEKMEYLALIWGTLVMAATGFVLWFKTWFTRFLPSWGYSAAELIHFYEAVLAFATIIIWHLYAVFIHTERAPFNPAWLTGQLTRHDMEHYHPKELERLEAEQAEAEAPEPAGPSAEDEPPPAD
jgi:cytochrome b subunit of formate dehydrogenase